CGAEGHECWRIFFPGNAHYNAVEQRNKAYSTMNRLDKNTDRYVGALIGGQKVFCEYKVDIKMHKPVKKTFAGLECGEHFGAFLDMMQRSNAGLNMPIVQCESLAASSIGQLLEKYCKAPLNTHVPGRINGIFHDMDEPDD